MKHFTIPLLVGLAVSCSSAPAQKHEFKEHISREFSLRGLPSQNTLAIYNVNGGISIAGYEGDKVIVEVEQTLTAKTEEILEIGKKEFKLNFEQNADTVVAYISEPYDSRPNRNNNGNDGATKNRKIEYNYQLEFTIRVPFAMNLAVSTVNGGDVTVHGVTGALGVSNVNGAIKLTNARGSANVRTINGNVEASFLVVPPGNSDFKTLNGDIKISYPPSFAADCAFKTFNGDFYTDFPNTENLPAKVIKNEENKNNKTVYKLHTETLIRFGNGGKSYRFETFNGNIYIKKQS